MRVTCIIIRIILHTVHNILHIVHNILHIAYNIFHIIIHMPLDLGIIDLTLGLPKMRAQHMGPKLGSLL